MDVIQVAAVCHQANRAYCESIGDHSQPTWDEAPTWQKESAINGVTFHLEQLSIGQAPSPAASHDKWLEEKRAAGWTYGPVKNPDLKQHPCFVPYEILLVEQRLKDYIFAAIVEAFFTAQEIETPT